MKPLNKMERFFNGHGTQGGLRNGRFRLNPHPRVIPVAAIPNDADSSMVWAGVHILPLRGGRHRLKGLP